MDTIETCQQMQEAEACKRPCTCTEPHFGGTYYGCPYGSCGGYRCENCGGWQFPQRGKEPQEKTQHAFYRRDWAWQGGNAEHPCVLCHKMFPARDTWISDDMRDTRTFCKGCAPDDAIRLRDLS